jgi:hypothetical protein
MLFLVNNSLVKKGSVRRCVVVMRRPILLSPKFEKKYSHNFAQSPWNVTVVCGIYRLAYQDEFFVNKSRLYRYWWVWTFHVKLMLSTLNSSLIIFRVSVALSPIFVQNSMLVLCRIHREMTSGQIHDCKENYVKNEHVHPAAWNFKHWLPIYCMGAKIQYI